MSEDSKEKILESALGLAHSHFDCDAETDGFLAFYEQALIAFNPEYKREEQLWEEIVEGLRWEREGRLALYE